MIIHVQFVCSHVIPKKREQEWEEDEDLNGTPIGVICFNHALILANKGFKVRAEVGDEAEECPLCLYPELYPEIYPDLLKQWTENPPAWLNPNPLLAIHLNRSREELFQELKDLTAVDGRMQDQITDLHIKNPSQQDILGYDLDDLGWWKCRTCGKIYHPSRFQEHMKDCKPSSSFEDIQTRATRQEDNSNDNPQDNYAKTNSKTY